MNSTLREIKVGNMFIVSESTFLVNQRF